MIGNENNLNVFAEEIQGFFKVKIERGVDDFVGCEFEWNEDGSSVILHQTRIIKK